MAEKPQHQPLLYFKHQKGDLLINQLPISQLIHRVGQTPFFAYDRSVIEAKVSELRQAFGPDISLHYAIKSNPMPALVDYITPLVDGLDVASGKELTVALNSGINPEKVSFAGPAKQVNELLMAIASGITINIESETELKRIISLCENHQYKANIALRINPNFDLKSSGMKMAGGPQQFGIDAEQVDTIAELLKHPSLNVNGLHIFTGSQNLQAHAIIEAHKHILELAIQIAEQLQLKLQHLNIGGGLGIPYFPGETSIELEPIAANLKRLLAEYQTQLNNTEIILELGRFLVGESGVFVSKVVDVKQSRDHTFIITDGGLHHHLAASGNFGQVIRKNYPVKIANKMDQNDSIKADIVGPLCTPLDILAKNMTFPDVEIGDLVAVFQSGAYGYTASPKDFLSHPYPLEVLI
ncbi:MAG: pyridoxal-dependent decarboxylase, exosortase A system-associated [Gammaproteobacteria bacterium]|nr:pyridoxal-dependent decarboxylase, exosortase A system-associated [Gammaproteobacteria bacterium]